MAALVDVNGVFEDKFADGGTHSFTLVSNTAANKLGTGVIAANANRVLIVGMVGSGPTTDYVAKALTVNGSATGVTLINSQNFSAGSCAQFLYGLINPPSGILTLVFSWTTNSVANTYMGGITVYGADQTTGWQNSGLNSANSATATSTITTAAGNVAIALHGNDNAASTALTIAGGTLQAWLDGSGSKNGGMGYNESDTSSEDITWTLVADFWGNIKVDVIAASGGGGPTPAQLVPAFTQTGGGYGVQYV